MARPAWSKTVLIKRVIGGLTEDLYFAIDVRRYRLHPTKGWKLNGFVRHYPNPEAWRACPTSQISYR